VVAVDRRDVHDLEPAGVPEQRREHDATIEPCTGVPSEERIGERGQHEGVLIEEHRAEGVTVEALEVDTIEFGHEQARHENLGKPLRR